MTWLVTGGAGFVGLHLLRRLRGDHVPARSVDLVALDDVPPGVEQVVGDVRDPEVARRAVEGVDVVVHAAAALPSDPRALASVNVEGTLAVARAARAAGVRASVLVSSAVVYGLQPAPLRESDAARPVEAYGRSKLGAERAWLALAPGPVVLRPAAVVGPERLGAFGILFRWVAEGRRVYMLGSGANRYQLLDVADLVEVVVRAGSGAAAGEVLNAAGVPGGTAREELEALIRHAGTSSRVVSLPAAPARAALRTLELAGLSPLSAWHRLSADRDVVLDCSRAESVLGWRASRDGAAALQSSYDWYVGSARQPLGRTHRTAWDERALGLLRRIS